MHSLPLLLAALRSVRHVATTLREAGHGSLPWLFSTEHHPDAPRKRLQLSEVILGNTPCASFIVLKLQICECCKSLSSNAAMMQNFTLSGFVLLGLHIGMIRNG